jgi:protoporphyrinogen oxidase
MHYSFCILGAGPSGLSFAAALMKSGCESFVLLEKESEAGGLCRSAEVDGAPLDIGGGHFLDLRRQKVLNFLFQFMPSSEWNEFERISKIRIRGVEIEHPLEGNLWQLPKTDQLDFIESIAAAGCVQGVPEPTIFDDWIRWKLGSRIADEYLLPYNRKIWSMAVSQLGTYWLHKLPNVSFRETLESCLERKPGGSLPAHGRFLYPKKHGYGEVWKRIAAALGDRFRPLTSVHSIDIPTRTVNGQFQADYMVNTIPWTQWPAYSKLPEQVANAIAQLKMVGVDVEYFSSPLSSHAHWIYEPDEAISYHRILLRQNFCTGSRGHWTETNTQRSGTPAGIRFRNEVAYPVNTINKPKAMQLILDWARSQNIIGLGRWGTWEHMNSDVAVDGALQTAEDFLE